MGFPGGKFDTLPFPLGVPNISPLESNLKRVFLCPVLVAAKPTAETDRGKTVFIAILRPHP